MESSDEIKKPNALHYIAFGMLLVGIAFLYQLKLVEGFSLVFLGSGIGLLGCEYDSTQNGKKNDKEC